MCPHRSPANTVHTGAEPSAASLGPLLEGPQPLPAEGALVTRPLAPPQQGRGQLELLREQALAPRDKAAAPSASEEHKRATARAHKAQEAKERAEIFPTEGERFIDPRKGKKPEASADTDAVPTQDPSKKPKDGNAMHE